MRGFTIRGFSMAVVALFSLLPACGRTDKTPSADSGAAAARAPQALVSARGPRSLRAYPGALTKPIDSYSGDEFYTLTRGLRYAGSHERERRCRNSTGCGGVTPARRTLVQVSAVATQDSLSAADVPEFGVVYARAINRGNAEEARYGLRPGNALRYYMIVHRDSAGALRWRLEELDTTPPRLHAQIGAGSFQGCGHAATWAPGARTNFKTCDAAERGDTVVTLGLALQSENDPMWTACAEGCCIYDQ